MVEQPVVAADGSEWVSAHAFYHGNLDRVLAQAVAPLVDELQDAGLLRGWFFLRYWEGGPHLRLRLLPAPGSRSEVESRVEGRLAQYLRAHPSRARMRQDRYAYFAATCARRERRDSYAEALSPNNTVSFIPYLRERDRYGTGASIEAVERHFADSSRIALRLLSMGTAADQRATVAGAVIMLTWLVWEPAPGRLAELVGDPPPAAPEPVDLLGLGGRDNGTEDTAADAAEQQRAATIARQMQRLAALPDGAPASRSGTLVDWLHSIRGLCATLRRLVAEGAFAPPSTGGWPGRWDGMAARHADVDVLPVLDICAHLFCNRLGLSLEVEEAARATAAQAVGEPAMVRAPGGG